MKPLRIATFFALTTVLFSQSEENKAQLFATEVLSPKVESSLTLNPQKSRLYFTRTDSFYVSGKSTIYTSQNIDGQWQKPTVAKFSGKYSDTNAFFSPDGKKLFFTSNRPTPNNPNVLKKDKDIWVLERVGSEWSAPKHLVAVNSEKSDYSPSVDREGNLYFGSTRNGGHGWGDIWVSYFKNGAYQTPVNLSSAINTDGGEWGSCISPDGRYLIFEASGRDENITNDGDLYLSENIDGKWSKAVHLGKLNSGGSDLTPKIHNGFLYFASNRHKNWRIQMNNNNVDLYQIDFPSVLNIYSQKKSELAD